MTSHVIDIPIHKYVAEDDSGGVVGKSFSEQAAKVSTNFLMFCALHSEIPNLWVNDVFKRERYPVVYLLPIGQGTRNLSPPIAVWVFFVGCPGGICWQWVYELLGSGMSDFLAVCWWTRYFHRNPLLG